MGFVRDKNPVDITISTVKDSLILDHDRVVGIFNTKYACVDNLHKYRLKFRTKRDLFKSLSNLATLMYEQCGYKFIIDYPLNLIWSMKNAGFYTRDYPVTAYYSDECRPIIFIITPTLAFMVSPL